MGSVTPLNSDLINDLTTLVDAKSQFCARGVLEGIQQGKVTFFTGEDFVYTVFNALITQIEDNKRATIEAIAEKLNQQPSWSNLV